MLDFENDPNEARRLVGNRVKGELLANLSDLQNRSGLTAAEIVQFWHEAMMQKLQKDDLEAYILFAEHSGPLLADSAKTLRDILEEDFRKHQAN